jgi:pimeloyl-ACP methyl ester carboxylesterase
MASTLPADVTARTVETERLETNVLESGDPDGTPVCLIHGNVSSARFWAETIAALPDEYRAVAPDLRGFGDSETKPIDAERGVQDFSEDIEALVGALGFEELALVGWSIGGGVAMRYAMDNPEHLSHLVLVDPMSPYGFGGTMRDGSPCQPDYAGTGGGLADDGFVERLEEGDRTAEAEGSPRVVMRNLYVAPGYEFDPDREDAYVDAMCSTTIGDDYYPGDAVPSGNWPGVAPGERGFLNAISPKYLDLSELASIDPKPPVLWIRGQADQIVSDTSVLDAGYLGQIGELPDWPGEDTFPPQPMVSQTRDVLDEYEADGGSYTEEALEGVGHSPHIERPERFQSLLTGFVE